MAEEKETVEKSGMSSQEVAVVNNMQALLSELLAMNAIDEMPEQDKKENMPEEEKMAQKQEYMDKEEEMMDKKEKGLTETMSDGVTANDKADEKMVGNIPEESKMNISEVGKALEYLFNLSNAQKSAANNATQKSSNEDKIANALNELTKTVKSINDRQEITENILGDVLKGMGVGDEIAKIEKSVEKSEDKSRSIRDTTELDKTLQYVRKQLKIKEEDDEEESIYKGSNHMKAHKAIGGWLTDLVQEDK